MAHAKIYLGIITRVSVVVSGVSTCLQAAGSGDTQGVWPELVEVKFAGHIPNQSLPRQEWRGRWCGQTASAKVKFMIISVYFFE